ncbi:MAG TPA: histidine kinase [Gemmatimonadaceae bacterium]|jgi:signal transduction histidine kinase
MGATLLSDDHGRHFPRGRELVAIAAFWTVFAALNITNSLFPPFGDPQQLTMRNFLAGAVDSLLWVIVTPPIFWMTSKFGAAEMSRARRAALYLIVGIFVALSIDLAIEAFRTYFLPPPPFRAGGPGGGFPPRDRSVWMFARGRLLNEYMIFLAVLAAGVARDYFFRYQRRLEEEVRLRAQLAEARFTVLQNQLNPHFLFNTLNAVATLVDRDPRGVRKIISRLSELLRATLEPSTDPELPLSKEIALTQRYLEILEIRFQGRLTTVVDAPPELNSALVPRLILQPLVENAMKHAVGLTSEPSSIIVKVRRDGYDLVLTVEDTGAGAAASRVAGEQIISTGIGLKNTRARLDELYGDEHAFTLAPNDLGGTTVTISLPFHEALKLNATPAHTRAVSTAAD